MDKYWGWLCISFNTLHMINNTRIITQHSAMLRINILWHSNVYIWGYILYICWNSDIIIKVFILFFIICYYYFLRPTIYHICYKDNSYCNRYYYCLICLRCNITTGYYMSIPKTVTNVQSGHVMWICLGAMQYLKINFSSLLLWYITICQYAQKRGKIKNCF